MRKSHEKNRTALEIYNEEGSSQQPSPVRPDHGYTWSYFALRRTIGWIGLLLPGALMVGNALLFHGKPFIHSISRYYYTEMRNVFVGGLCAIALFLFHYSGSDRREGWIAKIAGTFALGVAIFPVAGADQPIGPVAVAHYTCAFGLFIAMALMSLVFFGGRQRVRNGRDRIRSFVHRSCGITILASVAAILLHAFAVDCDKSQCSFVLWIETIALAAFGTSWLIEGRSFRSSAGGAEARVA